MRRPLLGVCLCLVILSALWTMWSGPPQMLEERLKASGGRGGEPLIVTGRIYQKEDGFIYLKNVSVQISAADLQHTIPLNEKIICEWKGEELSLGSDVMLRGFLGQISKASNPGEFDQEQYYRSIGICGRISKATLLAKSRTYSEVREGLYKLKKYWKQRLYDMMPEKEASVMSTMLLGDDAGLDQDIKELYRKNGIVHILSISGLHITIIGMGVYRLLRRLGMPVWLAAAAGGGILICYGAMTGLGVSACRAIGMYLIRMLGEICGRTYDMLTALGAVGAVTVLRSPGCLYHAGFLLSYGAVLGIGALYPALFPKAEKIRAKRYKRKSWTGWICTGFEKGKRAVRESAASSVCVTAATLPVLLWFYCETPVYSVFLNVLVLPLMKPVMLTGVLGMLVPGLEGLGGICSMLLKGYEIACEVFENLPFHTWTPGKPQLWQIAVYYLMLGGAAAGSGTAGQSRDGGASPVRRLFCIAIGMIFLSLQSVPENKVTFLDVGQGDCIFIQTAAGKSYLFDCGSSSRSRVGSYVLIPFLKQEGISHVDAVFVSHPDSDHCNGVEELLADGQGITVGELVLPDIAEELKEEAFARLWAAASQQNGRQNVEVRYIKAGDWFVGGDMTVLCLHPPVGFSSADANIYSQCFYVEWKDGAGRKEMSLLLTGDTEKEGEDMLLEELRNRRITGLTVLKTAHHGSRNATGGDLLRQLTPALAVISCGENNIYGHPHAEVLNRLEEAGIPAFQTPETGAVTITYRRGKITIKHTKP